MEEGVGLCVYNARQTTAVDVFDVQRTGFLTRTTEWLNFVTFRSLHDWPSPLSVAWSGHYVQFYPCTRDWLFATAF